MNRYALSHLSDDALLRDLAAVVVRDRSTTAEMLAHIAEVDARKLYLPAAYASMFAYCLGELHLSEDAAFKRITAARMARRFPKIFEAVAQGRLHLTAISLLAPHLTEDTAETLLAEASCKSKTDVERLLAERFPRSGMLTWVAAMPSAQADAPAGHAPSDVEQALPLRVAPGQLAPGGVGEAAGPGAVPVQLAPGRVVDRPRVTPLAPQTFAVQFTMSESGHGKLRYAQELLGHQVPLGDIAQVFEQALDALIRKLEKQKFAATSRPRLSGRVPSADPRQVPADVRRAVWERDGGRCTFTSESGHRCEARKALEFDHVHEVARGGEATVDGIRLRCRAHNQYAAERTFGAEFMRHKRIAAQEARAAAKSRAAVKDRAATTATLVAAESLTTGARRRATARDGATRACVSSAAPRRRSAP